MEFDINAKAVDSTQNTTKNAVASLAAWNFAQMDEVWRQFRPQTPYGKDRAAEKRVYIDVDELETVYRDVSVFEGFAEHCYREAALRPVLDKIQWHLGRIPRLPLLRASPNSDTPDTPNIPNVSNKPNIPNMPDLSEESGNSPVEVFLYKKFLSNYAALVKLVDENTHNHFGMDFKSGELLTLLLQGGSDPETFSISEKYDERLISVRKSIRDLTRQIDEVRTILTDEIKNEFGLDLRGREFVTIPRENGLALLGREDLSTRWHLVVEVHDEYSFRVRLLPGSDLVSLESRRETLYEIERGIEADVLEELSRHIRAEASHINDYCVALARFDLAKARYELKKKYRLVYPGINERGSHIVVKRGYFLPLCFECDKMGTRYTPLDLVLQKNAAVIFGSNMGGKTVVLKSVLFFQLMAQTGLGVPADTYETSVFDSIEYIGERPDMVTKGLSSFGFEVHSLSELVEKMSTHRCLVAFDEFAQTTSSEEAEALLSSVVDFFVHAPNPCLALFATHFHGLACSEGVQYLKMAGLDKDAAKTVFLSKSGGDHLDDRIDDQLDDHLDEDIEERIRAINRIMRYEVVPFDRRKDCEEGSSDALLVASLLGLDPRIVAKAESYRRATGENE